MLLLQSSDFYSDQLLLDNTTELQTIDYIVEGTKNSIRTLKNPDTISSDGFFDNKFVAEITGDVDVNKVIFKTGTPVVVLY